MSYEGFICLGGLEIVNNDRTVAYSRNRITDPDCVSGDCFPIADDCGRCPTIHTGDIYLSPADDPAPWFDPSVPESAEFHGLLVTSVTGLGPGKVTRSTTGRASGIGEILGQSRQASPVVTVTGILLGESCCGMDFGRRWLSAMLTGGCGDAARCRGEDMVFYTCCPDEGVTSPGESPAESPAEVFGAFSRTLKGAALISGIETVEMVQNPGCPCPLEKIEFQVAASWPCMFTPAAVLGTDVPFVPFEPPIDDACRFHWVKCPDGPRDCDDPNLCLIDPNCPPPMKPPRPPAIKNPCTCAPWAPASGCFDIDALDIPDHADGIPIITIRSGADELKHVSIRVYQNPLGLAPEELDPCAACGAVLVSRIPPNSVFIMDGTDRSVTVICPGNAPTDASPLLAQAGGRLPFEWPEIACGTITYTVCVEVDADTLDQVGASFDVALAAREC